MSNKLSTEKLIEKFLVVGFITVLQIIPVILISNLADIREISLGELNLFEYGLFQTATNYSLALLVINIATYFILESITKKKINYFQYLLIGTSTTVNLLLHLSIGEFIGFTPGFFISASMTILLNTFFSGLVSQDLKNPLITFLTLTTYYGGLLFYLQSSDYNLLISSILSFISVATLMIGSIVIQKKD